MLEGSGRCWEVLGCAGRCWEVLEGSGRCWKVLGCAGRCWEVLEGAGVCWKVLGGAVGRIPHKMKLLSICRLGYQHETEQIMKEMRDIIRKVCWNQTDATGACGHYVVCSVSIIHP